MRLAYSIAIQIPFDVLLLDEVLAVGDEDFQEKCFATFDRFKEEGKTVVFVSHALDLMERFCDRCLLLQGGMVQASAHPTRLPISIASAYSSADRMLLREGHTLGNKATGYINTYNTPAWDDLAVTDAFDEIRLSDFPEQPFLSQRQTKSLEPCPRSWLVGAGIRRVRRIIVA